MYYHKKYFSVGNEIIFIFPGILQTDDSIVKFIKKIMSAPEP